MTEEPPIGIVDLLQIGSVNEDDLPETLPELQQLREEAESLASLLSTIRTMIRHEMRRHLGRGGAMAWGDKRYIGEDAHVWEWTDTRKLGEWLADDAVSCVNGSHYRKTDVQQVAEQRVLAMGVPPEHAAEVAKLIVASYGHYVVSSDLKVVSADKAPVWIRDMEHGEIRVAAEEP